MKTLAAILALAVAPVLGSASFGAAPFTASATPAPAATPAAFGWRTFGAAAFPEPGAPDQHLDLRGGN